jgi:hypothetical protein
MVVSIHQPAYLPWLGYLARIAASDAHVFLDTVQYEKRSFTSRNRIKTTRGPLWLSVPTRVRGHRDRTLMDMEIDGTQDWRRRHLRAIAHSYRQAPRFAERFPRLASLFDVPEERLAELCFQQLAFWLGEFQIRSRVLRASDLRVTGRKSDLMLAICQHVGATTYLSGPLGRNYLDEPAFAAAGIRVEYHDYIHPRYAQLHGEFVADLSVVDYWLNASSDSVLPSAV